MQASAVSLNGTGNTTVELSLNNVVGEHGLRKCTGGCGYKHTGYCTDLPKLLIGLVALAQN